MLNRGIGLGADPEKPGDAGLSALGLQGILLLGAGRRRPGRLVFLDVGPLRHRRRHPRRGDGRALAVAQLLPLRPVGRAALLRAGQLGLGRRLAGQGRSELGPGPRRRGFRRLGRGPCRRRRGRTGRLPDPRPADRQVRQGPADPLSRPPGADGRAGHAGAGLRLARVHLRLDAVLRRRRDERRGGQYPPGRRGRGRGHDADPDRPRNEARADYGLRRPPWRAGGHQRRLRLRRSLGRRLHRGRGRRDRRWPASSSGNAAAWTTRPARSPSTAWAGSGA